MFQRFESATPFVSKLTTRAAFLLCAALSACQSTNDSARDEHVSRALVLQAPTACVAHVRSDGSLAPTVWRLAVVNSSGASVGWTASSNQKWLVLPVKEGSLPPRASVELVAFVDTATARGLDAGKHTAEIALAPTDPSAGPACSVEVTLDTTATTASESPTARGASNAGTTAGPNTGATEATVASDSATGEVGWTRLVPSQDSRVVYVSSSLGNDQNDGLSPQHPKASLQSGKALMRNGYPDWMCLQRGDTWTGSIGQWITSGRSASEPAVITSFGTASARPRIATGLQDGFFTIQTSSSPARLNHIAIVGLHFTCDAYTGAEGTPRAILLHVPFDDFLVEDCFLERFHTNVVVEPLGQRGNNFRMRRCEVVDAFTTLASHAQGLYISGTDGVVLEENLFDHNGWREDVVGAVPTIFRHNVYLQTDVTGVIATGNIFASGASHGLQARQGGDIEDNLFINNAIALLLGSRDPTSAPIRFEARRNVILAGRDINAANPRGFAIDVPAAAAGVIAGNVIVNQGHVGFPIAMSLYDGMAPVGLHDVVIEDNVIHDWHGPVIMQGTAPLVTGLVFRNNVITETVGDGLLVENTSQPSGTISLSAENRLWSRRAPENAWCRIGTTNVSLEVWKAAVSDTTTAAARPNYVDAERDLRAYDVMAGGSGSLASFMSSVRAQGKGHWNTAYTAHVVNDWIRAGFELAP